MWKPTKSLKVIRKQIERTRREVCMVVLHPDTVEWMVEEIAELKEQLAEIRARM